jgi:formyl-CoA transferase
MIAEIEARDGLTVKVPGVVPKLSGTPGSIRTTAPGLGDDTEAILRRLGYASVQIAALRADKVIGGGTA